MLLLVKHQARERNMSRVRLQAVYTDSSDCSSSDDECHTLEYDRYQAATIADGLRNRQFRASALRELQEVVLQGYTTASKRVQIAVYNDMLVAVQQVDSRLKVAEATAALLTAAKRVLPQQKRQQLIKEHKQAAVASKRAAKKHTGLVADVDNWEPDDSMVAILDDIPLDVVQVIMQVLDPISLAAAACVCRTWHDLATSDDLWQQHMQLVFPIAARQPQQQQCRSQQRHQTGGNVHSEANSCIAHRLPEDGAYHSFCRAAERHPSMLLPWHSCRALLQGRLQWLPAGDGHAPRAAAAARATRRGVLTPGPVYVDHHQAVSWMMGKPWGEVLRNSHTDRSDASSGSDSSSEGEGSLSHLQGLRLWAVHKPSELCVT